MTRYYETCGAGKFVKIEGELNPADMLTKPLPVGAFKKHRAAALGHEPFFPHEREMWSNVRLAGAFRPGGGTRVPCSRTDSY